MHIDVVAIIFDNDGVLVDSQKQTDAAWTQLADEFDLDYSKLGGSFTGRRSNDIVTELLAGPDAERAVERVDLLELESAGETVPIPGARELIETIPKELWAVATSATRRLAEARWRGAGIMTPAFSVTADEVTAGKPDPMPYLAAAELLGVDPTQCLVVEDSPNGGLSARDAGATVVAVGDQDWSFEPWCRVRDLRDLTVLPRGYSRLRVSCRLGE